MSLNVSFQWKWSVSVNTQKLLKYTRIEISVLFPDKHTARLITFWWMRCKVAVAMPRSSRLWEEVPHCVCGWVCVCVKSWIKTHKLHSSNTTTHTHTVMYFYNVCTYADDFLRCSRSSDVLMKSHQCRQFVWHPVSDHDHSAQHGPHLQHRNTHLHRPYDTYFWKIDQTTWRHTADPHTHTHTSHYLTERERCRKRERGQTLMTSQCHHYHLCVCKIIFSKQCL